MLEKIPVDTYMADDTVAASIGRMREIAEKYRDIGLARPADVALFYDPESLHYTVPDPVVSRATAHFQHQMRRSGIRFHEYLLADLINREDFPQYKMYVFYNCFHLDDRQREMIKKRVKNHGKVAVWCYASGVINESVDPANIATLAEIGFQSKVIALPGIITLSGKDHPYLHDVPRGQAVGTSGFMKQCFTIDDPAVEKLGTWKENNGTAFAVKKFPAWTSIYFGSPYMSYRLIRNIARSINIHCYQEGDDILLANDNMLMIHSFSPGAKTISLPCDTDVYDWFSKRFVVYRKKEFTIPLEAGQTQVFYLGPAEKLKAVNEIPTATIP